MLRGEQVPDFFGMLLDGFFGLQRCSHCSFGVPGSQNVLDFPRCMLHCSRAGRLASSFVFGVEALAACTCVRLIT